MLRKCDRCRLLKFNLESATKGEYYCKNNICDLSKVENIEEFEVECNSFDSKYIEYPLTINGIKYPKEGAAIKGFHEVGTLVKIRPCAPECKDKTYLGIYIGEIDISLHVSFNREDKILSLNRMHNPAIFVPELRKIIYGCESWWGEIKSGDELKEITNDDIDNVWYVKLLKLMAKEEVPDA